MFERPNNEIHFKFEDYRCVFTSRQAQKRKPKQTSRCNSKKGSRCIALSYHTQPRFFASLASTNTFTQSTFIPYNARATTSTRPASRYFYTSLYAAIPTITQSNSAVVASFALAPSPHTRWLSMSASIPQSLLPASQ